MTDDVADPIDFVGVEDNRLAADTVGDSGPPVLLLHGGGQTRNAWAGTAGIVGRSGRVAISLDQRGHGESDWVPSGHYRHEDFSADLIKVVREITAQHGAKPTAIGASFGGLISLLAQGDYQRAHNESLFAGLALVDITLQTDPSGVAKIQGFMLAHAQEGFASVDEAADAVAAYMPHRPRPRSTGGLRKNLRQGDDGRWRWHWDPRFLSGPFSIDSDRPLVEPRLYAAARELTIPSLLVRGGSSELVQEEHARAFLALAPHTRYVDVAGARHMVAGDANDLFTEALLSFLDAGR